jgi:O-antigen biosynthesis protein
VPPRSRNILAKALRRVSSEIGRRRADRLWKRWQKTEQIDADVRFRRTAPIVEASAEAPTISILLPVYNISEDLLRRCISSVRRQSYTKWQLCIADDASNLPHVRAVLTEAAQNDSRIASVFRGENGNISAASNTALDLATGEFCALLDHDDELAPHALFEQLSLLTRPPTSSIQTRTR